MQIIAPTNEMIQEYSKISHYHSNVKKCDICGVEFDYGRSHKTLCELCRIQFDCSECGKTFILDYNKMSGTSRNKLVAKIKNKEEIKQFCSIECTRAAMKNKNTLSGFNAKYCDVCKMKILHNGSRCYKCDPWDSGFIMKKCNICNKIILHAVNRCYECNPWNDISLPDPNWENLSLENKIIEEEKWIENHLDSKSLPYHKQNLSLLKMQKLEIYDLAFSDLEKDPDLNNPDVGWIYGHIDIRNGELYYVGQTIRNPIKRYSEHYANRLSGLYENFYGLGSQEEYIRKTGIT